MPTPSSVRFFLLSSSFRSSSFFCVLVLVSRSRSCPHSVSAFRDLAIKRGRSGNNDYQWSGPTTGGRTGALSRNWSLLSFRVGGHLTEGNRSAVLSRLRSSSQVKAEAAINFTTRPSLFEGCFDCNKGRFTYMRSKLQLQQRHNAAFACATSEDFLSAW